jgi:hypothetical protein
MSVIIVHDDIMIPELSLIQIKQALFSSGA